MEKSVFRKYFPWVSSEGIQIKFTISYKLLLVLLTIPYLIWEINWAYKVGYACVKWHTHLMMYLYIWLMGYLLVDLLFSKKKKELFLNSLLIFSAVIFTLFLVESSLFILKIKETHIESFGNGYYSWHNSSWVTWYRSSTPHKEYWLGNNEFNYPRIANSLGFSDIEWKKEKKANEKRILSLGDSFTEGDGAPFDSTYVSILRNRFMAKDSTITIMNAGTCGNDPFVNFVNYRDRLYKYNPDEIIQTLSSGDLVVDIMVRGGMERFQKNGKVQYKKAPWWEPIYALNYTSRLFFSAIGYNELLMNENDIVQNKKNLDSIVVDLFKQYATLAKEHNCKLTIVLQPFRDEVISNAYQYDFTLIKNKLKKIDNIHVFDLMPFYISKTVKIGKPIETFYWPIDGHHNSDGYAMMADGIYSYLNQND